MATMRNAMLAARGTAPVADKSTKLYLSEVSGDAIRKAFHAATGATVTERDYAGVVGAVVADVRGVLTSILVSAGVPAATARKSATAQVTPATIKVTPASKGTGVRFGFYAGQSDRAPGHDGGLNAGTTWSDATGAAFRAALFTGEAKA